MDNKLWTKNFIFLLLSNALLFAGFHILLPTLPIYAAQNGGSGTQIGIIAGIFGFSAIFIRFFTDLGIKRLGKKKCLIIGIVISFICAASYVIFSSVNEIIGIRLIHGFGFGLATTFYATIASDIVPYSRRGEGMGYFGLGTTVAMALAPAAGVWLVKDYGFTIMFTCAAISQVIALIWTFFCSAPKVVIEKAQVEDEYNSSLLSKFIEKGTRFPAMLTMFFGVGYGSVIAFIAMLAQEAHIENPGYFYLVGTLCIIMSRTISGRLFDKKGYVWVILPGAVILLSGLLLLTITISQTMLLEAAVLYGFGVGMLHPALQTWMLNLVQAHRRGAASATFYNMLDVGTSAGTILLGIVAEKTGFIGMYRYSAGAMGIFLLAFVLFVLFIDNRAKAEKELEASTVANNSSGL
ncbi:MAG: mdtG 2 [Firmicutes bacterium]|nr:mdtG 2 [Bacillota bacterium]